jgi:putative FmdB family regulatory protein
MPLYEYRCEKCGELFEVMQKFTDEPLAEHTNCGGAVHRLLSAPALQFKGSGWYITDYAKGGGGNSNSGGKAGETNGKKPATDSSSTKTDSPAPSAAPAPASSDTK